MNTLRKFFIVVFLIIGYAGTSVFYLTRCNPKLESCRRLKNIMYPAQVFDKALWEVTKLIRIKMISGEFLTTGLISNKNTRERFKNLDSGFNFYYTPGERPDAGFLLLSRGNPESNGLPSIELWDLNKQKLINSYNIDLPNIRKKVNEELGAQTQFRHPILLEDGSIITSVVGGVDPLIKLDKCGKYIDHTKISGIDFHHSLEIDEIGRIYSPIKIRNSEVSSNDGYAILDQDLNLIKKYTLDNIFKNNLIANDLVQMNSHLNDVEPVQRSDGTFINLLSLRDQSRVIAFDPNTNEIIWILDNAFSKQHDVDVLNKKNDYLDISIFDNNQYKILRETNFEDNSEKFINNRIVFFNDLPIFKNNELRHLSTKTKHEKYNYSFIDFKFLKNEYIPRTDTQGLSDFVKENNSIMVEESNNGHLFEIDLKDNQLLWQYINKEKGDNKITYQLNWSRRLNILPSKLDLSIFKYCEKQNL